MTNLVHCLQPVMTAFKKYSGNQLSIFAIINKYWGQVLYNWFKNIKKAFGSNKFFCHLETIVR